LATAYALLGAWTRPVGLRWRSGRSANRAARTTERALQAGLLPVLVPSHMHDPPEKIRFIDDDWVRGLLRSRGR